MVQSPPGPRQKDPAVFLKLIALATLAAVLVAARSHTRRLKDMSAALDNLAAKVAAIDTVIDSAVTTIQGLAQQVRENLTDPSALQRLADDLDAKSVALAAAIAESTSTVTQPEPPAPVEEPAPEGDSTTAGSGEGESASGQEGSDSVGSSSGEDSLATGSDETLAGSEGGDTVTGETTAAAGATIGGAGGSDVIGDAPVNE